MTKTYALLLCEVREDGYPDDPFVAITLRMDLEGRGDVLYELESAGRDLAEYLRMQKEKAQ